MHAKVACWIAWLSTAVLAGCASVGPSGAAPVPVPANDQVLTALDRLEDVRLLLHSAMWNVHEARALAMAADPGGPPKVRSAAAATAPAAWMTSSYEKLRLPASLAELDDLTKEGLWLYETVMAADESGQSLCSYRDSGGAAGRSPPYLMEDVRLLEQQTAAAAGKVIDYYRKTARARDAFRTALRQAVGADAATVAFRPAMPWSPGPREWGRQTGLSVGWPMLLRPYDDSAQALLNKAHSVDNAYLLRKARKLGVGHVQILDADAASWRGIERRPGEYDFANLDAMLGEVRDAGLRAIIRVPSLSSACPAWVSLPDGSEKSLVASDGSPRSGTGTAAFGRGGTRDQFAFFQEKGRDKADESINLFNPAVRAPFAAFLTALGKHLQSHWRGTILAVQLDGGFACFVAPSGKSPSTDVDYSRFAKAHWQGWLKARYGTVQALNAAWGAAVQDWGQIELLKPATFEALKVGPHGTGSAGLSKDTRAYAASLPPRQWNDFLDWREDYVAEYYGLQADLLRRELPGVPALLDVENLDGHVPLLRRPEFSWNGSKLASRVTDLPEDLSSAEWAHKLLEAYAALGRGGSPAEPCWLANEGEKTFGSLITHGITSPYYKDAIILNHRFGPGQVLRYFHDVGTYNYMDQQLSVDGANSWFQAVRQDHAIAPEILNTKVLRGQVAVLWPEATFRFDPDASALREAECWGDAMHALGYAYDYLLQDQLTSRGLEGYKALVLPAAWCLDDDALAAIRQFVQGGGVLIATSAPGSRDALGQGRKDWPLADVFGADRPEFLPITPVVDTPLGIVQPEGWWEMDGIRQREGDLTFANRLCCTFTLGGPEGPDLSVRAKFVGGRPAVVSHRFGKGRTLLMGYPFGSEYGWSNYNEIGFGKIHGDTANLRWQRALEAYLRTELRAMGLAPVHEPLREVTLRPMGRELEAPSLGYPQGGSTWENYMDNVDDPSRVLEFTLRGRSGVDTRYLCVWNREGQYGASRGYVHHFAAPKYAEIRLNMPGVQAVYDVALGAQVRFIRQGDSVVFRTCLAPCMGRMFAISTGKEIALFEGSRVAGISDEKLLQNVASTAATAVSKPPRVLVLHEPEVRQFLESLRGKAVRIGIGDMAYQPLGERLAAALRDRLGCQAACTLAGVQYSADRLRHRFPAYAAEDWPDIVLGNEWDNQLLAYYTATAWVSGRPRGLFLPAVVNKAFPGAGCGVLELSRPYEVVDRRNRPPTEDAFYRFDPAKQQMIVGGSDVSGTAAALEECLRRFPPK